MHRRFWLIIRLAVCLMCFAAPFSGCSEVQPPTPVKYVIGVSQANMREPWRLVLSQELRNEAENYPQVRLVFTDATSNSEKQIADIQRMQEYGIDLLIVSPHDAADLTQIISEVYQTTPVIVLDRMVEGFNYTLFIGPDNHLIGKQAGEAIIEIAAGEPCAVLQLCGNEDTKTTVDRSNGFLEAVTEAPLITIDSISVEQESRDAAEATVLTRRPDLDQFDLIFAHNDYMALGAHRALQQLGLDNIQIVGIDGFAGEDRGLEMVRSGVIDRTITCPTGGREAIRNALDILGGASGVPKQIILRSSTIDAQNLARYEQEMNKKIRPPKENIRVGYAQIGTESQWRLANNRSITEAAKEFDVDLTVEDGNQSQQRQIEAIRRFIAEDMDVIVLSPVVDTGWDQVLREAKEAGIPVLLSDRKVSVDDENLYMTYIGADFIEEGRRAMRWIMQNVNPKNSPVRILEIQGTIGASPTIERKSGFEMRLNGSEQYQIIYSESGDFTIEGGRRVIEEYLKANPFDIDVIFSHNDDMALGAVEALEQAGIRPGIDVKIVSVDGTKAAVKALADGKLNCVVECSPMLGPQLMKAIKDLMSGQSLPLRIITDEIVFTSENAKEELRTRVY